MAFLDQNQLSARQRLLHNSELNEEIQGEPVSSPQLNIHSGVSATSSIHQKNTRNGETSGIPKKIEKWEFEDPYRTHVFKDKEPWEGCFDKVRKLDDEMCRGWREEIDTLLIFAGLFSATVTAFAVEAYQWLQESPSDTLARLQLKLLLNDGRLTPDAAILPVTFHVSGAVICINTFWFASLTLSLASVVVSILCKQWLYEYQRYENLTGEQCFLIRELRYKGLRGWRVPTIISTLPLILQAALVLFLLGLLVLLWTLQTAVATVVSFIVGSILAFLITTSVLPSLQYIFPLFNTQCAYKSSQSWLLFLTTVAWMPEESWVDIDLWETTNLDLDQIPGLWQFYEAFATSADAVRNVYHCLANIAPSKSAEFVKRLKSLFRPQDIEAQSPEKESKRLLNLRELSRGRFRPDIQERHLRRKRESLQVHPPSEWSHTEHRSKERALSEFLMHHIHMPDSQIFNRHAEHCVRLLDNSWGSWEGVENALYDLQDSVRSVGSVIEWDNAVASHLIRSLSSLFTRGRLPNDCMGMFWDTVFSSLVSTHRRHILDHTPYILLTAIQNWIDQAPEVSIRRVRASGLATRLWWTYTAEWNRMTPVERGYTKSLAQYIVDFWDREGVLDRGRDGADMFHLRFLRLYLDRHLHGLRPDDS